jgi:hypothetical protein
MAAPLRFLPMADARLERWTRPRRFDFLDQMPTVPIADTEVLHLSHYCPVVISLSEEGPRVAILLDPALAQPSQIGRDGRWNAPYTPMALRSLPFRPGARRTEIEIAVELAAERHERGFALRDTSGKPTHEFAVVLTLVDRLHQGMRCLCEAAKLLVAADILTNVLVTEPGSVTPAETQFLTVSPQRFAELPASRAAALSIDRCLPLDLLTACLHSQRLLSPRISLREVAAGDMGQSPSVVSGGPELVEQLDLHVRLDDSPLFSFERLQQAAADHPKAGNDATA